MSPSASAMRACSRTCVGVTSMLHLVTSIHHWTDCTQYIYSVLTVEVAEAIERFSPRTASAEVAGFARELVRAACPKGLTRAEAWLFAACRLGMFCESVGLELVPEVVLCNSVIERLCHPETTAMSQPTRRTVRSNLRAITREVRPGPPSVALARERAKAPYSEAEIACYLSLADAQPTEGRRRRASALVCLSAGAGLVGQDLRGVCGTDVAERFGGVVVTVTAGRRPRVVPVLDRYHERLLDSSLWAADRLLIGGTSPTRRNVTTPLSASLAGGADLPRLEVGRLRATWLCEVAEVIGLRAFMDAAGITCSQRLGDLVASLPGASEVEAVRLLGGRR